MEQMLYDEDVIRFIYSSVLLQSVGLIGKALVVAFITSVGVE